MEKLTVSLMNSYPERLKSLSFDQQKPAHAMSIFERWMTAQISISIGTNPEICSRRGITISGAQGRKRSATTWHSIQDKIDKETDVWTHLQNYKCSDSDDVEIFSDYDYDDNEKEFDDKKEDICYLPPTKSKTWNFVSCFNPICSK